MIKKFNENWDSFDDFLNNSQPNPKDKAYWKSYWDKLSRDINFEMDTIAEYAKKHSISYEDAKKFFLSKSEKPETPVEKEVKFNTGTMVIGLPSGQVIYMNLKQLTYFKNRNMIAYVKKWKKPIAGGFIPYNIENFCFEDTIYNTIVDLMDTIIW